jgi:RNA polymerase sigma-70 factor (ECF subfamily)
VSPENPEQIPDWNAVIERAKNGDDSAACWLVEALHGHVLRIVRNHLPRCADEQDLVQEVFMKVFANIDRFRGEQPFPNWVARISLNTCYDHLRKQKARAEVRFADLSSEDLGFVETIMLESRDESSSRPERDGRGLVDKLLTTLNPRERMVVQMIDLEKKSVREVCELTGWGASKVKVTAMRARRKLNGNLKQLEGEIRP